MHVSCLADVLCIKGPTNLLDNLGMQNTLQDWIGRLIRECSHELEKFPAIVSNMQELQRRKELKAEIERHKEGESRHIVGKEGQGRDSVSQEGEGRDRASQGGGGQC